MPVQIILTKDSFAVGSGISMRVKLRLSSGPISLVMMACWELGRCPLATGHGVWLSAMIVLVDRVVKF
jgi:hypothetical protein